jgi:phosphoglycolate phosphatase
MTELPSVVSFLALIASEPMHGLTLVFDLDGTLVDTAPDLVGATNHALAAIGLAPVEAAPLRPWISFGARRMIVEALQLVHAEKTEAEIDSLLDHFLAYYDANIARESRPFAGAIDAAQSFKAAGALLAICTNKRERLSRTLINTLGIGHLFDALAGRDTFPVSKPHPGHVLGAIRLAGGNAARAIMIGDSEVDIRAAKAAGIPVVACSFGYSLTPVENLGPDAVISHFDELSAILRSVLASRLASDIP